MVSSLLKFTAGVLVAIITVCWTSIIAGGLSWFVYPYGWWAVLALLLLGMFILNIVYLILALPSLIIFLIKDRSQALNISIVIIYIIGLILSIISPWYTMKGAFSTSSCIIALTFNIVMIIYYKRKCFELFESD